MIIIEIMIENLRGCWKINYIKIIRNVFEYVKSDLQRFRFFSRDPKINPEMNENKFLSVRAIITTR